MQYAKCISDGKVWEAKEFSNLPSYDLEAKRLSLICNYCGEFAWYRKESRHGHPAHFCARHDDDCDLKAHYELSDVNRDEALTDTDVISASNTIIVRLDQEKGGKVEVSEVQPPPDGNLGEGGRSHVVIGKSPESVQQFTLRKILLRLVQSEKFRSSDTKIIFYRNENNIMLNGPVHQIVCGFENIDKAVHDGNSMFYWGPIASAKYTPDGKLWLNSGLKYQSVSVAIFNDVVDKFLDMFEVKEIEDLAGAYVLVAGRCDFTKSGEGKPVIWCGNPQFIFVKEYKGKYLSFDKNAI